MMMFRPVLLGLLAFQQLFSAQAAYSTHDISELHPIQGFKLSLPEEDASTVSRRSQHNQPYPDTLQLHFSAQGRDFSFDLEIVRGIVDKAEVIVYGEGGRVEDQHGLPQTIYRQEDGRQLANFHLRPDGLIQGIFVDEEGELFNVEPFHLHAENMDERSRRELGAQADMVMFHQDAAELGQDANCGVASPSRAARDLSEEGEERLNVTYIKPEKISGRQLLAVQRWTNCFPNDAVTRRFQVAFAADLGYYKKFKSSKDEVTSSILAILSSSNMIYKTQINVFLSLGPLHIQTTGDQSGGKTWNRDRAAGNCDTINSMLTQFRDWRRNQNDEDSGLFHLMTDCFPPPGTVGVAYVGVLCIKSYGSGVSTHSSSTWKTVAHELGHNFGANHAFQEGQGKTGGIMDYGNGLLNGEYQFHTKYNKEEVCKEITDSMALNPSSSNVVDRCWNAYQAQCGNGIIEDGEDCDDTSSCCVNCKLKAGATCSGGPCCDNCVESPSSKTCGTQGFCQKGQCETSVCAKYNNIVFGGMVTTNACQQTCTFTDSGKNYPASQLGLDGSVKDGSVCGYTPYSTCKGGKCVSTTNPSPTDAPTTPPPSPATWVRGTWSACSKTCGGGTQTRTVVCRRDGQTVPDATCTDPKPSTSRSCNTQACPVSTSWTVGEFGDCSKDCGGGTQTRTVTCVDQNGQTRPDGDCSATKPSTSQACNSQACPDPSWSVGGWGGCSVSCGGGKQVRKVVCKDYQGQTVADSLCAAITTKPATERACNAQECALWTPGSWEACSATCGGGTQWRKIYCTRPDGTVVPDSDCTGAKPASERACNTQSCSYVWVYTRGPCQAACEETGIRNLNVWCADRNDVWTKLDDSKCSGNKPASTQACTSGPCTSAIGGWDIRPWSACNPACGSGTQTREVSCTFGYDPICSWFSPKPATSQACKGPACAIQWQVTQNAWTSCSTECGPGIQSRVLECSDGVSLVDLSQCSALGKPIVETRPCFHQPCAGQAGPNWVVTDEWEECSASCDEEGARTRVWICVDEDGTRLPDSDCQGEMPRNVIQPCFNSCEQVDGSPQGLSTGAIVGIAVGVIAAALVVSATVLGVFLYKKKGYSGHGKAPTLSTSQLTPEAGQSTNPLYGN